MVRIDPGSETPGDSAPFEFCPLKFRSFDLMSLRDRDLAADAEASIDERAGFAGLEFNRGKWSCQ